MRVKKSIGAALNNANAKSHKTLLLKKEHKRYKIQHLRMKCDVLVGCKITCLAQNTRICCKNSLKGEKQNVHAHFKDTFPVKNALQRKGETRISVE
jgi:hypothetical protein